MKKFFKEFKAFISRGNIIDLAIGVIIGTAFSAIVTAFTNKIIMPLINYLLSFGAEDGLASAYTFLKKVYDADGAIDLANSIYIDWGAFITAVIDFLIIAFTLFIILKVAMKSSQLLNKTNSEFKKMHLTKEEKMELKEKGVSLRDMQAIKEYKLEKEKQIELEKQKAEEEEKAKKEADRLANPTQEDLLKEIRDLLKEKNNQ